MSRYSLNESGLLLPDVRPQVLRPWWAGRKTPRAERGLPVMFRNGQPLFVNGLLAMRPECCCVPSCSFCNGTTPCNLQAVLSPGMPGVSGTFLIPQSYNTLCSWFRQLATTGLVECVLGGLMAGVQFRVDLSSSTIISTLTTYFAEDGQFDLTQTQSVTTPFDCNANPGPLCYSLAYDDWVPSFRCPSWSPFTIDVTPHA